MTGNFTLLSAIPIGVTLSDNVSVGSGLVILAIAITGFFMKMRDNRAKYLQADLDQASKTLAYEKDLRAKAELALAQALAVPIDLSTLVDTIRMNHSESVILIKEQTTAIRSHESGAVLRNREVLKAMRTIRPSP